MRESEQVRTSLNNQHAFQRKAIMSAPAKKDTTAPGTAPAAEASEASKVPQLGALEEDDEFEEFPVEGELFKGLRVPSSF